MRTSSSLRVASTLVVAALVWAAPDSVTIAAKAPILVSETSWDTVGSINFQPGKGPGTSLVQFGLANEAGQGDFLMPVVDEFAEAFTIKGTYAQDPVKGKLAMTPDPTVANDEVLRLIRASLVAAGLNPDDYVIDVEITKAAAKAKPSASKTGEILKASAQVKSIVLLTPTAGGDTIKGKFGFSYKGQGAKHVNNGG